MRTITFAAARMAALATSSVAISLVQSAALSSPALEDGFRDPPKEARPSTYYLLLNGHLDVAHMERELDEFHRNGIAGLCVFDMGARGAPETVPPAGPTFLSDEWLKNFARLLQKAGALDMDVQLSVSSSWDMGASWVEPEQASMGLYHSSITREGPGTLEEVLPLPEIPTAAPRDAQGQPRFWKEVAVLAIPVHSAEGSNVRAASPAGKAQADTAAPAQIIPDRRSIRVLSRQLGAGGRLQWNIPEGRWTIVRYVCANTGEHLKVPSPKSDGLATDHFSARATSDYVRHVLDRLEKQVGNLRQTPLRQLYLASYEVRGAIWTPEFLRRFQEYRGYDMTRFLPALSGYVVDDQDTTDRFLYDYRQTLGDLVVDAYYRTAHETVATDGLGIEAEAGGPGPPTHQVPVDALKALGAIDELRGEFWPWRMDRPGLWVVKETASAAHIYGRRRVHMEAFTSFRHWQDGPFDLKPSADRAFCEGMNHVVWHTASHQPPEAGRPGWVYGAGTHLTPNLVWWPMAKPFLDYLARCSFLLQQGLFVADVCYYYGDQGFNFVPPKHVDPSLGFGYDYDVTNAEVLLQRMQARDGRLVLPDGMSYELLVLPQTNEINDVVLQRIATLVRAGATVVGPKPARATGLRDQPRRDQIVRRLAADLWGPSDGRAVLEHRYGRGRVIWGKPLRDLLRERLVDPDFSWTSQTVEHSLDFIHRRTPDADIYFLRNPATREVSGTATFRVRNKRPEFWFADTGKIEPVWDYQTTATGTQLPVRLGASESIFVVFRDSEKPLRFRNLDPRVEIRGTSNSGVEVSAYANGSYGLDTISGQSTQFEIKNLPAPIVLTGPWRVTFPSGLGAPAEVVLPKLKSWTEDENPAIRYFSGVARYALEFELPPEWLNESIGVSLDLGALWTAGEVHINGKPAAILWKPPYKVDLTALLKPGRNLLEIDVANTWANRVIGDSRLPKDKRRTRTNITGSGTPRKAWRDIEPRRSGLFGPVTLRASTQTTAPWLPSPDDR